MADKTTTALTPAGALDGTELLKIVQGGNSRRSSLNALKDFIKSLTLREDVFTATGSQSFATSYAEYTVTWTSRVGDNLGITPGGAMSIPAALNGKRIRLTAGLDHDMLGNLTMMLRLKHNGNIVGENTMYSGLANAARQVISGWFTVATSDTISLTVRGENGGNIQTAPSTFLCVEVKD